MLIEQQIALEWLRRWRGETWTDMEIVQQVVAQFSWRSNIMLLKNCWNLDRVLLLLADRYIWKLAEMIFILTCCFSNSAFVHTKKQT